jgi:histone H3/H4
MVNTQDPLKIWKLVTTAQDKFTIKRDDQTGSNFVFEAEGVPYMGIGVGNPNFPIEHSSGAHLTDGGVWTDASSRSLKNNIRSINAEDAYNAIREMEPVTFEYLAEQGEQYAGFIAEDVPEIVAHNNRKSLSPMDVVAVLTKVVKEQDKTITDLQSRLEKLEAAK